MFNSYVELGYVRYGITSWFCLDTLWQRLNIPKKIMNRMQSVGMGLAPKLPSSKKPLTFTIFYPVVNVEWLVSHVSQLQNITGRPRPPWRPASKSLWAKCFTKPLLDAAWLKGGWLKDLPKMKKERVQGIPSGKLTVCYWKWPFIVDFPIKNGDFP